MLVEPVGSIDDVSLTHPGVNVISSIARSPRSPPTIPSITIWNGSVSFICLSTLTQKLPCSLFRLNSIVSLPPIVVLT